MGGLGGCTENRGYQCRPARAHQAAKPEDFTAMGGERYALDLAFAGQGRVIDRKISDFENLFAAPARALRIHLLELAADHPGDDLIERDIGYRRGPSDCPAVTQHHDAI